jgi:hypothetical protein
MAVLVGCWPNANAANSSRPRAFSFFIFRVICWTGRPGAARCGPMWPHATSCDPMRPHAAPCGPMHLWPHAPGFSARAPVCPPLPLLLLASCCVMPHALRARRLLVLRAPTRNQNQEAVSIVQWSRWNLTTMSVICPVSGRRLRRLATATACTQAA